MKAVCSSATLVHTYQTVLCPYQMTVILISITGRTLQNFRLVEGGVQPGPLGTAATDWPIVACLGWLWWGRIWWKEDWQGKPKYTEKPPPPRATLSTTNPTWPDPGSNPGRRGGKPATNRLSYCSAKNSINTFYSMVFCITLNVVRPKIFVYLWLYKQVRYFRIT
jgi:hypothetical protein